MRQQFRFGLSTQAARLILAALIILLAFALLAETAAGLTTSSSSRDCDSNAVIMCGAMSTSELQSKYNNQASVRTVFHNFGITHIDINGMDTTAVAGKVTRGGRVLVGDNEVATNAMTAGMQDIAGSQKMTANGVTFFMRSPSVSFTSSSLPAFVVMKDGQFAFAVINSCGNPVKATPIVKQKQTVQPSVPQQTTPVTPPPPQVLSQSQTQQQSVTVNAPQPAPSPQPQPVQVQPKAIPNTGAGNAVGIGALVAIPSSIAHYMYRRSRIRG
jgi:hypothetical protein